MVNPYAYFDSLSISHRLQENLGNIVTAEIYLFSYLACILSLYRRRPISDWQYKLSITEYGFPYSVDLDNATKMLEETGNLAKEGSFLVVTEKGNKEYEMLCDLSQNVEREVFIAGGAVFSGRLHDEPLEPHQADRGIHLRPSAVLLAWMVTNSATHGREGVCIEQEVKGLLIQTPGQQFGELPRIGVYRAGSNTGCIIRSSRRSFRHTSSLLSF